MSLDPTAPCPCKSGKVFGECCAPHLEGGVRPATAEELMRSRYSAFVVHDINYLRETLWPKYQPEFDAAATARWAAENHWTDLTILGTEKGTATDRDGTVLFEARYLAFGKLNCHRELSRFRKKAGRWYYVEALEE